LRVRLRKWGLTKSVMSSDEVPFVAASVAANTQRLTADQAPLPLSTSSRPKVFCVFGTRPEVIKLAPVIQELARHKDEIHALTVTSGQHTDLIAPFLKLFQIQPDFDLKVMKRSQSLTHICSEVMARLTPILVAERPQMLLVQGDTTTALAAALTAFYQRIPVGHVEAGLRSGNATSPYPEEMNRRLISQVATYQFAATEGNRAALLAEGCPDDRIFMTGNPVVDALHHILQRSQVSAMVTALLQRFADRKLIVLTTHRRESFGQTMRRNLRDIRRFVEAHQDVALIFPVHPNPNVVSAARAELGDNPRIAQIEPLDYSDFLHLLQKAWLILSDSGGIQEEAPSLGKPVFVLRNNTERPEAIESGVAFLVGNQPGHLASMLQRAYGDQGWLEQVKHVPNPFGDGSASRRIADVVRTELRALHERHGAIA
jgi:UDP-N-acetylglucosamine 2-epimerase (non-hydrolysing)